MNIDIIFDTFPFNQREEVIDAYFKLQDPQVRVNYTDFFYHAQEALQQSTDVSNAIAIMIRKRSLLAGTTPEEFSKKYQLGSVAAGEGIRTPITDLKSKSKRHNNNPYIPNSKRTIRLERGMKVRSSRGKSTPGE